ncbi:MAG TPA: TolC family protein [Vicinamibacterales bacterium]|nr:TolC family protein [Vicinamibacterales bacterium]
MKSRLVAVLCALLVPASAIAQPSASGDVLTLKAALQLALAHNRQVQVALLNVEKADAQLEVSRLRRLPKFELEATASQLLTPVGFSFPRGAFGEFPGTGPIPADDTTVSVPLQPTFYLTSQVSQPLTQLFRINLGIRSAEASRDIERERARAQQLSIADQVKRTYFAILQTESALNALDESIALYRELDRTLQVRVLQQVALRSDSLDVQYQLAQAELSRTVRRNAIATQKEQLNQLLGRDIRTAFDVATVSEIALTDVDLEAAQARALASRPDVREAQLTLKQAELDRRLSRADRIPEVSLAVSYSSYFNMSVLPSNLATAGVKVTWEPFDWGRKNRELAVKTHTVQQARLSVRDAEDRAALELSSRFRTLAEKRAQLTVARAAQGTAREKLRVKTNQFEVQAVLLPDVLQQRASLADADDAYQQAILAFWVAKADFEKAIGEEVIP